MEDEAAAQGAVPFGTHKPPCVELEKVQRLATKLIRGVEELSYEEGFE